MPTTPPPPVGRTAQRLEWRFLPPHVRALVASRCGSQVVDAVSQGGGYTPGFASVLTCADGSRHFVKAASAQAQRPFAASYREEARKLSALPDGVPAARLRWLHDDDWVVLGLEYVEGRAPRRPWRTDELERCLDAVEQMSLSLTPAPAGLELSSFADEFAGFADAWDHVRATQPDLPHLDEAAELATGFPAAGHGDSLVHTDLRDDNLILGSDGRVWMCDWNWPVMGAPWLDTLLVLLQPRGDGLDVNALLAGRVLTREVEPALLDSILAFLCGYFFKQRDEPVPATSPYLRQHQSWCAEVAWEWLGVRRGWRD